MPSLNRLLLATALSTAAVSAFAEVPFGSSGQMPPSLIPPAQIAATPVAPAPRSLFTPSPAPAATPAASVVPPEAVPVPPSPAQSTAVVPAINPPAPAPIFPGGAGATPPIPNSSLPIAPPVPPKAAEVETGIPPGGPMNTAPALPALPKLPEDAQARVNAAQVNIFLYQQLATEAAALKALCETDYGPSDLCRKGRAPDPQPASAPVVEARASSGRISLLQVLGDERHLSAVLQLSGGRELTVHEGSSIPGSGRVVRITPDEVRLTMVDGREGLLSFEGESILDQAAPASAAAKLAKQVRP